MYKSGGGVAVTDAGKFVDTPKKNVKKPEIH